MPSGAAKIFCLCTAYRFEFHTVSNMAATQKPRLLMLGDPPQLQLEQWNRFQQRFDIVRADLSDRETFLQSLRDQK